MKKIWFIALCMFSSIASLFAEVPAKQSLQKFRQEMIHQQDATVMPSEETSLGLEEVLNHFDRKMKQELRRQREVTLQVDRKLKHQRDELVHEINEEKRTIASQIIQAEQELSNVIARGERRLHAFDEKMKRKLLKQQSKYAQLDTSLKQARRKIAHNIALPEEESLKGEYAITASINSSDEPAKIEDPAVYLKSFKKLQEYLAENKSKLKKEALHILSEYKCKRKASDRSTIVNNDLKKYVNQLNDLLKPFHDVPQRVLESSSGKELVSNIRSQLNPMLTPLQELFTYEASRLKQTPSKALYSERLYTLYDHITQPLKVLADSNPEYEKNINSMHNAFNKLKLRVPH